MASPPHSSSLNRPDAHMTQWGRTHGRRRISLGLSLSFSRPLSTSLNGDRCTDSALSQLYSPLRPLVDIAEVFLWLIAVGTILCASYWSAWSAREAAIEQDNLLKDASDEFPITKDIGPSGVVDVSTTSAVLFVVVASCFLIVVYKLMSSWSIELLVILFAVGGVEGLLTCLVSLLSRWFKSTAESFIKVPFFGAVSYLTLIVSPFCIAFAAVWARYRDLSFAWIVNMILVGSTWKMCSHGLDWIEDTWMFVNC